MADYDRSAHPNACPCKLCVTFDIAYACQETGATGRDLPAYHAYVTAQREKKLNWNLPDDHCILCGGSAMNAWAIGQHYQLARHNEQNQNGKFYTSLLLHKDGPLIAVYRQFVAREGGWGKMPFDQAKARFTNWVAQLLDLLPEKAVGYASRDIGDWIEIRMGFTELVEENYEQRIERYRRTAGDSLGPRKGTAQPVQPLQGASSLAWHANAILAPSPGRVPDVAREPEDAGTTDN